MATSSLQSVLQTPASSVVPFAALPNIPKPIIPQIDLGIQRIDVEPLVLAIQDAGSISSSRKVGFFIADRGAQTEASDVLELKQTTSIIQTLVQDVGQLRKDLIFAQNVLKADYENRLNKRAIELYCRCNERCAELDKLHTEKIDIVRMSYRTQLNDAIQKIAGEYKAYLDEILQGKTGRAEAKIKELKQKIEIQELRLEQGAETISVLTQKVNQYEEHHGKVKNVETPPTAPPHAPPPGISLEEAEELQEVINKQKTELSELKAELTSLDDTSIKLTRKLNTTNKQLEDERKKVARLKLDMEAVKNKSKTEQEKAKRLGDTQMAALERQWKDKSESAEKEAARKTEEQADLQRIRDQLSFQQELDRQKSLENELRTSQLREPSPPPEGDLGAQIERLKNIERKQKLEIERRKSEFKRMNRVWEMKLTVMQRNFHALRDESYIRQSLQRQSASLHQATVGYSATGYGTNQVNSPLKVLPQIKSSQRGTGTVSSDLSGIFEDLPRAPSPSPQSSTRDVSSSPMRTVRFSEYTFPNQRLQGHFRCQNTHNQNTHNQYTHNITSQPTMYPQNTTSKPDMYVRPRTD